jgi:hypothetical protein
VQQPTTAFAKAVDDIETRGSKDRRPARDEDTYRKDNRQPSDVRRGRNQRRNETMNDREDGTVKVTATMDATMTNENSPDDNDDHDRRGGDRQDERGRTPKQGLPINDDDGDDGSGGGQSSEEDGRRNRNPQDDAPQDSDTSRASATRLRFEFDKIVLPQIPTPAAQLEDFQCVVAQFGVCLGTWRRKNDMNQ